MVVLRFVNRCGLEILHFVSVSLSFSLPGEKMKKGRPADQIKRQDNPQKEMPSYFKSPCRLTPLSQLHTLFLPNQKSPRQI